MRPHGPCAPLRAVLIPALLLLLVAGRTAATNPQTTSATAAAPIDSFVPDGAIDLSLPSVSRATLVEPAGQRAVG